MLAQQSCSAKALQARSYARATRLATPINTLPKWHDLEDSLRNQKRKPPAEIFPWPDIPQPVFAQENMKVEALIYYDSFHTLRTFPPGGLLRSITTVMELERLMFKIFTGKSKMLMTLNLFLNLKDTLVV